jgi:pyruvate, orthophosphate dikinase
MSVLDHASETNAETDAETGTNIEIAPDTGTNSETETKTETETETAFPPTGLVRDLADGDASMAALLGDKGANLAEMTRLGLPVPPGFTITTEACRAYPAAKRLPPGLVEEVSAHLTRLEQATGRTFGSGADPLLVSARSGSHLALPGMSDTVLNIGLCDATVEALAASYGGERFAWDCYRRMVQMYGQVVFAVPAESFELAVSRAKVHAGHASNSSDTLLGADQLRELTRMFQAIVLRHSGQRVPQDPREQLFGAVRAVYAAWNGERAEIYRRSQGVARSPGTAVTVMAMVFGNLGNLGNLGHLSNFSDFGDLGHGVGAGPSAGAGLTSGTGVASTRDPVTGAPGGCGHFLAEAEGEDVVSGARNPLTLAEFGARHPFAHDELERHLTTLEGCYRDQCDVEFTMERGKLWLLEVRPGRRSPAAAFRIAATLLRSGIITEDEALSRVTGDQLARLMIPSFAPDHRHIPVAVGIPASLGVTVGRAVFDSATAVTRAAAGEQVILIRRETTPDDLPGITAATGVLTGHGGRNSHAAVVARGLGRACVSGADTLEIDETGGRAVVTRGGGAGTEIHTGDVISIDGASGAVYNLAVPIVESPVAAYFESGAELEPAPAPTSTPTSAAAPDSDPVVAAVVRLLAIADERRHLGVRANADTPADAARARRFGANGIGLARTERMFLGERRPIVERLILADRTRAFKQLLHLQRADFVSLLTAMDGLPVTVRLLDPPLHELLGGVAGLADLPDLRGVRLGLTVPGIYAMQVRALAEAMVIRRKAGGTTVAHLIIPLIADARELDLARRAIEQVLHEVDLDLPVGIGAMIELPRAALTAGAVAEHAEFLCVDTDGLTRAGWGLGRGGSEGAFVPGYLAKGVFAVSPLESVDLAGVGELIRIAVGRGRAAKPGLEIGVCGEPGGDPDSIRFFHDIGVDYVSCDPVRVPIARLEAGRAAIAAIAVGTAGTGPRAS